MAITPADFVKKFPELAHAGNTATGTNRIADAIADAMTYCDPTAFGVRYELAVMYKAAALLGGKRYGQIAPTPSKGETDYEKEFLKLRAMVPFKGLLL